MKILKNILLSTLLSTKVFASELEVSIPQTIEKTFRAEMSQHPSNVLMDYFDQTGMMIFPYLQGEDLQNWITGISGLLQENARPNFRQSMNINFFGSFYPRANITRIQRPLGTPDAYIPFNRHRMMSLFPSFTSCEIGNLLNPFHTNASLPQRELFLHFGALIIESILGTASNDIIIDQLQQFTFKEDIIQKLIFDPRLIRTLGDALQTASLVLNQELSSKIRNFSDNLTLLLNSENPIGFIRALPQISTDEKETKAFLCVSFIKNGEVTIDTKFKVVHVLKDLDSKYTEYWAPWCLDILNNSSVGSYDRIRAASYLNDLPEYHPQLMAIYLLLLRQPGILDSGPIYSIFQFFKGVDPVYHPQIFDVCRSMLDNSEVRTIDKTKAALYLKDFSGDDNDQIPSVFLDILEDPLSTIENKVSVIYHLKMLMRNYPGEASQKITSACLYILEFPSSTTHQKLRAISSLKDFQGYRDQIESTCIRIIESPTEHISDKLSAFEHLEDYRVTYQEQIANLCLPILADPDIDLSQKFQIISTLKTMGSMYHEQISQLLLPVFNNPETFAHDKLRICAPLIDIAPEYHEEIATFCAVIFNNPAALNIEAPENSGAVIYHKLQAANILKDLRPEYNDQIIPYCASVTQNLTIDLTLRNGAKSILNALGVEN